MYAKLIAIADWLEKEAQAWQEQGIARAVVAEYCATVAEVRAMAKEMRDRVIFKPVTFAGVIISNGTTRTYHSARLPRVQPIERNTPDEAIAALQSELDKL